jgi:hypothetical protein
MYKIVTASTDIGEEQSRALRGQMLNQKHFELLLDKTGMRFRGSCLMVTTRVERWLKIDSTHCRGVESQSPRSCRPHVRSRPVRSRPGRYLASYRLIPTGAPVLRLVSSACMPSSLPGRFERACSLLHLSRQRLPCEKVRSAPCNGCFRPAQRSLTSWPARSPSRLATLYIKSSDSVVALPRFDCYECNEPVPGQELRLLKSSAFSRRPVTSTMAG